VAEHTVIVIGAGASLAEAQNHRPARDRDHPPLDGTFFRRVSEYRPSPLLGRVEKQAIALGIPDLLGSAPPTRLESYLGRLYFEINHNPLAASVRAYFEAIELYAREVTMTTNWMMGRSGLIKKLIQSELRAGRRVSIVTFNIDLLAENALCQLAHGRPRATWSLEGAYGFAKQLPILVGKGGEYGDPFPEKGAAEIPVYKMHGSINWVFKHRDRYPPADLVKKDRELYLLNHQQLPRDRIRVQTGAGRPWYSFPLIVPPVYEKHAFIRRHLQEVWGYSFPLADTHARHFFQARAQRNAALRRPVVINPDPAVGPMTWEVLRPSRVEQFRSAEEYLDAR
jgi:hypothetical protein